MWWKSVNEFNEWMMDVKLGYLEDRKYPARKEEIRQINEFVERAIAEYQLDFDREMDRMAAVCDADHVDPESYKDEPRE